MTLQQLAFRVKCPRRSCGALPGEKCMTWAGEIRDFHIFRLQKDGSFREFRFYQHHALRLREARKLQNSLFAPKDARPPRGVQS